MNKNFKFITGALSMLLCFAAMAFGQRTSGNIEGTVTDPNGAVVPNATVTARSTGTTVGFNQTMTTDSSGFYRFAQVPVGTYEVTATGTGFQTTKKTANVVIDKDAAVDFQLTVGQQGVTVDVTADATTTLDPTDTKIDTSITKQVMEDLPTGAGFTSLLKIAPNVRPEPLAAGFQIDGASGAENVFNIDGQEVTNFRTGQLNTANNLPFELVQEVQVKSTGYEAEWGGATGGVIQVITPGGNDMWHGNFGVSFGPQKLNGDPRPALTRFSSATTSTNTPGNFYYFNPPKAGGVDFFPVANISGPVIKNKLWFSAIYAPQYFDRDLSINYFGNSIAGNSVTNPTGQTVVETINYSARQVNEYGLIRFDAQPHARLRAFGTFLWNPVRQEGLLPANTEGLGGAPQEANFGGATGTLRGAQYLAQQGGRQNSNNVNGQVTWNPTNWLIINGRMGRTFLNEKLSSYGLPRIVRYNCSASGNPAGVPGSGCQAGFNSITNNFQIDYDVSTRNTYDIDAATMFSAGGRHNVKFGYQSNKLFNSVSQGYTDTGIVVLFYQVPISSLTGQTATAGNLGSGYLQRFGTVGEASSTNQALFVQDSWQIGRVTVNGGIRIEKEEVPTFNLGSAGGESIEFGWGDKISPRIGVAWDVTGDGKNKIFGNYGIFYDRFKYELPRGSFGGDFFRRDYFEILPSRGAAYTSYTRANILGGRADVLGGTCPISPPVGYSICQFDFRIATNIAGANIFETGAVDPDLKAARQSEYTFGYERQLGTNFLFSGRYTHKQIDRAIEDVGVFNAQGSEAYIIGNPGFGLVCEVSSTANLPCPKAERKYDALEVRIDRRATNYFFNGSYTWSRLFGNYSGLASSDEFGRSSPNVNRFFDLPMLGFTADGDPDNGRLATDRPHVFKAYGGYNFNWNSTNRTTVSGFTTWASGTPLTTIYTLYAVTTAILNGRGDLGRTEAFTQTDISVKHRYKFGRDGRFGLEAYLDILNLFDEKNVLAVDTTFSTADIRASNLAANGCATCTSEAAVFQAIFNGPGIRQAVVNFVDNPATPIASRRRNVLAQPNTFQVPRDVRFGFRFFF